MSNTLQFIQLGEEDRKTREKRIEEFMQENVMQVVLEHNALAEELTHIYSEHSKVASELSLLPQHQLIRYFAMSDDDVNKENSDSARKILHTRRLLVQTMRLEALVNKPLDWPTCEIDFPRKDTVIKRYISDKMGHLPPEKTMVAPILKIINEDSTGALERYEQYCQERHALYAFKRHNKGSHHIELSLFFVATARKFPLAIQLVSTMVRPTMDEQHKRERDMALLMLHILHTHRHYNMVSNIGDFVYTVCQAEKGTSHMSIDQSTDFDHKQDRKQTLAKRQKGKERRLRTQYSLFYNRLEKHERGIFTGDFDNDIKYVFGKFVTAGYNPNSVMVISPALMQDSIKQFIRGRGLMNMAQLIRLSDSYIRKHGHTMDTVPLNYDEKEPGEKIRSKLILLFPARYPNFCVTPFIKRRVKAQAHMLNSIKNILKNTAREAVDETLDDPEVKKKVEATAAEAGKGMIAGIMQKIQETMSGAFSGMGETFLNTCNMLGSFAKQHAAVILSLLGLLIVIGFGVLMWRFLFIPDTLNRMNMIHDMYPEDEYEKMKKDHEDYVMEYTERKREKGTAHQKETVHYFYEWSASKIAESFGYVAEAIKRPFIAFNIDAKRMNDYFALFKNAEYFSGSFTKFIKAVLDWISTLTTGKAFFKSTQLMREWYDQTANTLINLSENVTQTVEEKKQFIQDFDKVAQTAKILYQSGDIAEFHRVIKVIQTLHPRYAQYKDEFQSDTKRMQPLVTWLNGPPGTGKSYMQDSIPKALFDWCLLYYPEGVLDVAKEFSPSLVWNRKAANEYCDGWHEQLFTNIDDMFVALSPDVRYLEALEFMAMKNDAPYMLHMAGVDDKGKSYFKSRAITVSTNWDDKDVATGITDIRAVKRRRDFIVETGFLGPKVEEHANTIHGFKNMWYKVKVLNLSTGLHSKPIHLEGWEGFAALIEMMGERFKFYHQASLAKNKQIEFTTMLSARTSEATAQMIKLVLTDDDSSSHEEKKPPVLTTDTVGAISTTDPPRDSYKEEVMWRVKGQAHQGESFEQLMALYFKDGKVNPAFIDEAKDVETLDNWMERTHREFQTVEPQFEYTTPTIMLGTVTRSWMFAFIQIFPGVPFLRWPNVWRALMDLRISSGRDILPHMLSFFTKREFDVKVEGVLYSPDLAEYIRTRNYSITSEHSIVKRRYIAENDFNTDYVLSSRLQATGIPSYYLYKLTGAVPDDGWYKFDLRRTSIEEKMLYASKDVGNKLRGNAFLAAAYSIVAFLIFVSALVGIILLILHSVGFLSSSKYEKMKVYANAHSTDKLLQRHERKNYKVKPKHMEGTPHGLDQGASHLSVICAQATKRAVLDFADNEKSEGWIFAMGGNTYAMPNHYLAKGEPVRIRMYNGYDTEYECVSSLWNLVKTVQEPERDLCFMYIPGIQPTQEIISKHGRRRTDGMPTEAKGVIRSDLIEIKGDTTFVPRYSECEPEHFSEAVGWCLDLSGPMIPEYTVSSWVKITALASDYGDCGFSYMSSNPSVQRKYLGLNIGGNSTASFCAPIYLEDYENVARFKREKATAHVAATWVEPPTISVCPIKEEADFGVFKGLSRWSKIDHKHTWSKQHSYSPTIFETGYYDPVHKEVVGPAYPESDSLPAKLDDKAFDLSFRKCKGSKFWYDPEMEDPEVWKGVFTKEVGLIKPRLLDMEKAILGIVEWQNFHSIDLTTSAGYPWKLFGYTRDDLIRRDSDNPNVVCNHRPIEALIKTYPKEEEILDYEQIHGSKSVEKGLWVHPALQSAIYYRVHHGLNNRFVPAHYLYSLKNEMRPREKVELHYTRGFKAGALDYLIFVRMATGHFVAYYERDHQGDCAVGIDPQSSSWGALYRRLCDINPNLLEGDHSAWDLHMNSFTYAPSICEEFRRFYGFSETEPMYFLFRSAVFPGVVGFVVIGNYIYIMYGQNSGQPITSVSNSWWNSATKRSAWKRRNCIQEITKVVPFDKIGALTTFGDDFDMAVKQEYMKEFNTQKLAQILKVLFNQEITTSSKSGEIPESTHISETNFLQRKFVNVKGVVLAPLNPDSIKQMVRWNDKPSIKSKMTKRDLLVQIAHGACHEWALHGREAFEENVTKINKYLASLNRTLQYRLTYDQAFSKIIENATS